MNECGGSSGGGGGASASAMAEISPLRSLLLWKRPGLSALVLACGSLLYYHCTARNCSLVSLTCDVVIVLVSSLAILGLAFRNFNIAVPVDPLEWQVSEECATSIAACIANTVGATEGVLRVAASGSDYKLFFKVVVFLYLAAAVGRAASGATVTYIAFVAAFIVPLLVHKLKPKVFSQRRD
ncbi:reticulon-like protein B23 isoform X2 [Selaginella moellendorffii]|uniref:reticulon-like protein B23 isoform X2 n=1 Tax=Selaginella moellendorffii TaxID=88036 RepID=UPI000D1CF6DA|nr:reticulon-like protein B23 isoform X2 [Selaginella moellendorffii]|eukprot:XP_024522526.1 reticulon-like protein B23 isoform X2 [Selaginella moellendorffii]